MIPYPEELEFKSQLIDQVESFFSSKELDVLARKTRFVERSTSKLNGLSFLMMNVFNSGNAKETSLMDLCQYLEEEFEITMSKQSLDERYNTYSVDFMRSCFTKILHQNLVGVQFKELGALFKEIILTDATSFQIPESLSVFYKSTGGAGSAASVKIHQTYDLLTGQHSDIKLVSGSESDNSYQLSEELIKSQCLYIRDLGYHNFSFFEKVNQKGGYYLSRFKSQTCLFSLKNGSYQQLDVLDLLPEVNSSGIILEVYLGKERVNKLKTNLIIEPVPKDVAQQRLEDLLQGAKRNKKWNVSEKRKQLTAYNLYITNIPEKIINAQWVRHIYMLRWQIELLFKIWKSLYEVNKIKKMSIFRFECYLYGKLIAVLLSQNIQSVFKAYLYEKEGFEISEWKSFKQLKKN